MDQAPWLGPLARAVSFAAMLLVVGGVVFRYGVLRPLARTPEGEPDGGSDRAALVGLAAAVVLAIGLAGKLGAQLLAFADPEEGLTADLMTSVVGGSAWGRGFTLQIVAAGLAIVAFAVARMAPRLGWPMAAVAASAVALAAPLTGHATGHERAGSWGYPLDLVHVLGGGGWLGTLGMIAMAGFPAARRSRDSDRGHRQVAAMTRAFSPIALSGAMIAVGAGVLLAWRYLAGSLPALWTSGYGQMLIRKLVFLSAVMAVGAWNWRRVTPALGTTTGSTRIRRSSRLELVLGFLLLVATALLVAMPMPGEE